MEWSNIQFSSNRKKSGFLVVKLGQSLEMTGKIVIGSYQ